MKHAQTPHCLVSIHDGLRWKYLNLRDKSQNPRLLLLVLVILFDNGWSELVVEPRQGSCGAVQPGHVSGGGGCRAWRVFPFLLRYHVVLFCSFDALVLRFEAPDSRNRWDSPLFTILKDDPLPCEAISDALYKRKAPPPNQSTQSVGLKMLSVYWTFLIIWACMCKNDYYFLSAATAVLS